MKKFCILCLIAVFASLISLGVVYYFVEEYKLAESEEQATHYYGTVEPTLISEFVRLDWAEWIYRTSSVRNFKTGRALIEARNRFAKYVKKVQNGISIFRWKKFVNPELQQSFRQILKLFYPFVTSWDESLLELQRAVVEEDIIRSQVRENFSSLTPGDKISAPTLLQIETNLESEKEKWTMTQNSLGLQFSNPWTEFVRVFNNIAESRGYLDGVDMFFSEEYEIPSGSVQNLMRFVWKKLQPLHEQLIAYYRWTLVNKFGHDEIIVTKRGTIPLHVISYDKGGHWIPVPNTLGKGHFRFLSSDVISPRLNWTPLKLYEEVDRHFSSMNFTSFPKIFWTNFKVAGSRDPSRRSSKNMNTDETNVAQQCEPFRYIAGNISDFRVSACEEVTLRALSLAYQKIGIMKHFILASNQSFYPLRTRGMEILGEPFARIWGMMGTLPKNLKKLAPLTNKIRAELENPPVELERGILYEHALQIIPELANMMSHEAWRWSVFQNKSVSAHPQFYNCHYWKFRNEIEGVKPPITRKSTDFDPGSSANLFQPFGSTREFIITILQFQIFRSLCITAGEYIPGDLSTQLHQCEFWKSETAIEKVKEFMKLGSSKPWLVAFEELTGIRDNVDSSGILEYFQPLYDWLKDFNLKNSVPVGWLGAVEDYPSCTNTRK